MKIAIKTFAGFLAAIITAFFVFAFQGMETAAALTGILALLVFILRTVVLTSVENSNPFYMPTRAQRVKMRKRLAKA